VTGLFNRLGSAFIAPPDGAEGASPQSLLGGASRSAAVLEAPRRQSAPPAASLAVLCRPDDALTVGGVVALALAARCRSSRALVALWRPGEATSVRAPATAGARRLAATLEARGHGATASGRLTIVRLASPLSEAAPEAVRALAAAGEVPAVAVLAGARDGSADSLLRDQDGVLVALPVETDDAVGELALAGLAPLGVEARTLAIPAAPAPTRALASSGVAVLPPLRDAVEAALASLPALAAEVAR